jgi:hypothetical protein
MRLTNTLLFFLFSVAIFPVFSQVPTISNLALGDTSQVFLLQTTTGDRLLGKQLSWRGDSLTFLQNGKNKLGYRLDELTKIEPWDGIPFGMSGKGLFVLKTKNGKSYTGYLVSMKKSMLKFKALRQGMLRFKPNEVESVSFQAVKGKVWKNFANDYRFTNLKGKDSDGKFISFSDGLLQFQKPNDDTPQQASPSSFRLLRYRKPREPVLGYERAFMFAPTGFNLKKGQLDFRNVGYWLHNSVGYGVSDNFSVSGGTFGFIPMIGAKASFSVNPYVHMSAGAFTIAAISFGAHASLSVGTPDYFLNVCYFRNTEAPFDSDLDFAAMCYGASLRTGRRSRIFGEYILINEKRNEFGDFSNTLDGRKNAFTWGVGLFGERTRLELGMMLQGPNAFCFFEDCEEIYTVLPVISGGAKFGGKPRR